MMIMASGADSISPRKLRALTSVSDWVRNTSPETSHIAAAITTAAAAPSLICDEFPAVTVPGGWVEGMPVGLELLARPWEDTQLLGLAHAFEQATRFRRPPGTAGEGD